MSKIPPELGDLVLYTDHNVPPNIFPGTIVRVVEDVQDFWMVNIVAFSDDIYPSSRGINRVVYGANGEGGTWRWK